MKVLVTGGCGFIGSSLAIEFARAGAEVACFDNLSRRGSELILGRVREHGCAYAHGDARNPEDLSGLKGDFDLMIECSAEPSVMAGAEGDDAVYMLNNNLGAAINCFEFARRRGMGVIFLSTSRVYPYERLNKLEFVEKETRFEFAGEAGSAGARGVSLEFPLDGARSLYGATKLCAEFLLKEYSAQYGVPAVIDRCGVVAGPWQMGKTDQGIVAHWAASHYFGRELNYIGFGGKGKQVRDILHVNDLAGLVLEQARRISEFKAQVFNAGGGAESSVSLQELTRLCAKLTGRNLPVGCSPETRPADVVWYVSDCSETERVFGWRPRMGVERIVGDTVEWIGEHAQALRAALGW